MEYFGFMVCELDGDVEDLQCNVDYKPQHEQCGWSFAKWFKTREQRDKIRNYTIKEIKKIQNVQKPKQRTLDMF